MRRLHVLPNACFPRISLVTKDTSEWSFMVDFLGVTLQALHGRQSSVADCAREGRIGVTFGPEQR